MRLLLLRHGQTPSNVAGVLDTGYPGAGLTELGVRQAEAVPGALAGEAIAAIAVSPLVRTGLTAAPLARERGITVRVQPGLEEISAGDWELSGEPRARNAAPSDAPGSARARSPSAHADSVSR
ncbi:MAG: histidine phosphatase family protein [Microbacterium sp.]